jgi:hypothetical protein
MQLRFLLPLCALLSLSGEAAAPPFSEEQMCDLSVTLHPSVGEASANPVIEEEEEEEGPRWRRHRNHLFFPVLGSEMEDRLLTSVVVFTLPKGGSHLIYAIFELIAGKISEYGMRSNVPMGFPIDLSEGREVFFSPLLGSDYRKLIEKNDLSKVIMLRDPRDLLISQLHWIHATGKCPGNAETWHNLSMDEQIKELLLWNSPQSIASLTKEMVASLHSSNTHICRFEELIGENGGGSRAAQESAIASLSRYVGCKLSDALISQIADQSFRLSGSLRRDQVGVFRSYFSEENQALCKQLFGREIALLGYPAD